MAVANVGWDLEARSGGGRIARGLGSQARAQNERRFSVPWTALAPRMREYVQAVRAIWLAWKGDGKLAYEGKHYRFTLMTPNFVPEPYDGPLPRLGVAAVGPVMLKVAAEESDDRKLHSFCTKKHLDHDIIPIIDAGLAARGRTRESFEISGGGFVVTGKDDAAGASLLRWGRYRAAVYGSTPRSVAAFARHG